MLNIFSKIFGSSNDRTIRKMQYLVDEVNKLADEMSKKDDEFFTTLKDDLFNKYHKDKNINAIM